MDVLELHVYNSKFSLEVVLCGCCMMCMYLVYTEVFQGYWLELNQNWHSNAFHTCLFRTYFSCGIKIWCWLYTSYLQSYTLTKYIFKVKITEVLPTKVTKLWTCCFKIHVESWMQHSRNSNISVKLTTVLHSNLEICGNVPESKLCAHVDRHLATMVCRPAKCWAVALGWKVTIQFSF